MMQETGTDPPPHESTSTTTTLTTTTATSAARHSSAGWLTSNTAASLSCTSPMLCASFNQDGTCLAIGTQNGFSLFNLTPQYQLSISRDIGGGLAHVEMLFRCNLLAIVGGGVTPKAAPHVVLVWDDHVQKAIGELSFRQSVLAIKLRRDSIAVALRDRIYVYHLADLSLRDKVYTTDNPHGLMALSTAVQDMVLACPSTTEGHVRVELYGLRKTVLMEAHNTSLRQLALTEDGKKLATCSIKGTIVRVFCCHTSTLLHEFRRGVERVDMTGLVWSWDHSYLACCSDKGTAHVFGLHRAASGNTTTTTTTNKPSLSSRFLTMVSKSGDLPKSISQVRGLAHPTACAFVPDQPHTLAVVGWDERGNGVVIVSDVSKEDAVRRGYHVISKAMDTEDDEDPLLDREARRRQRLTPQKRTDEPTPLLVGDRVLVNITQQIVFTDDDDGFLSVNAFQENEDADKHDKKETVAPERVQ